MVSAILPTMPLSRPPSIRFLAAFPRAMPLVGRVLGFGLAADPADKRFFPAGEPVDAGEFGLEDHLRTFRDLLPQPG